MEKQTTVEWLVKEFSEILGPLNTKPMQDLLIVDAIKKAKAMEKEQSIHKLFVGFQEWHKNEYGSKYVEIDQFYEYLLTFKSEEDGKNKNRMRN